MRLITCFLALATAVQAAVPLLNPRITGTSAQVASGTFTIKTGATFAVEAGAFFDLQEKLPLNAGGTGVSLSDPGADRLLFWDDSAGSMAWLTLGAGLSTSGTTLNLTAAPVDATYITQTSNGTLTAEQALSGLATGLLQVTTSTGVLSSVTTSAGVAALLSDETGTGAAVFATSPTITTPTVAGAITFPAGVRQTFAPNATNAGLNVGSVAGDPSTPSNGDLWYDSTANELTARINGSNVALGAGGGGGIGGSTGATDNALIRADGTGGSTVQSSNVTLADSGTAFVFSGAGGITASGTDQNVTLTPSGTGQVRAANKLYVGEGSAAFSGYQSLIIAREGNSYGGAVGIHHGSNATDNFAWTFQRARGTLASPSAVQSGDRLGQFTFSGWDGSVYRNAVTIYSDTTQSWSGSAAGAALYFGTTPNGSTTRTVRMSIGEDGRLYLGDTTAGYASGSSGAIGMTAQGSNQNTFATPSGTGVFMVSNGTENATIVANSVSKAPLLRMERNSSTKANMGVAGTAGTIIAGSAVDDLCIRSDASGSSVLISANAGGAIGLQIKGSANQVLMPANITSTSASTGTLVVTGGVGISENLYVGGIANLAASTPKVTYNVGGSNFANYLNLQPTTSNSESRVIIAPSGTATNSALMLQSNSSVDTANSEYFGFGGGFSGSVSGSWNFGSMVYGNTTGNSRPISFSVSNSTDGRIEAVRILNTGQVDVKRSIASTSTTTGALTVAGGTGIAGNLFVGGNLNIATSTPASSSATGTAGTIAWDASYIYICTATNTWKRVAIATW